MSAFKSHKRKQSALQSPSPKKIKEEVVFSTANKTPKLKIKGSPKTPNLGQAPQKGTPVAVFADQKPYKHVDTPKPKLDMFKGTGKSGLGSPITPNDAGKMSNVTNSNQSTKNRKRSRTQSKGEQIQSPFQKGTSSDKKPYIHVVTPKSSDEGETPNKLDNATDSNIKNRHSKRRILTKEKRRAARNRFQEIKNKAIQGDQAAREEIQQKINALEAQGSLSKTQTKKLSVFKRILFKDGSGNKSGIIQKTKKETTAAKMSLQKKVINKQQNGKTKKPQILIKNEPEADEEEDASDDEGASEDEGASDDDEEETDNESDEDNDPADKEVSAEADEEEGSDEVEGEDDDEDEDNEDDDDDEFYEEETSVKPPVIKKPVKAQKNTQQNKPPQQAVLPNKSSRHVVFVGNIAYATTEDGLREHFKAVGEIVDIRIPTNENKKPRGFAYVELKNEEAYQKALSLHNTTLGGRKINVLYTQGGKKKSNNQKGEIKAKNFKLQAMRKQGKPENNVRTDQKRSGRPAKNKPWGS